jgi:enoyl-CoA hydratase/carnithine racemase
VIAAVNGLAFGGGFEVALACDIVIAAQGAKLGLTEARVGLYPAAGGIQRLIRQIGPRRANALLLTGRPTTADEALGLGLVNEVVAGEFVLDAARKWAQQIMLCSPAAIRATMAIANLGARDVQASMVAMMDLPAVAAIGHSPDMIEGAGAFAERRSPNWSNPEPLK